MFKVLSPFVLVCTLKEGREEEKTWDVETIRFASDRGLVLQLRQGVRSTVKDIRHILDWKIVHANEAQGITFSDHLNKEAEGAKEWLEEIAGAASLSSSLAFWREPAPIKEPPPSVRQNILQNNELIKSAQELLLDLQEDISHWQIEKTVEEELQAKEISPTAVSADEELLRHLNSSYAAALRGSRASVPLDFGGHLICAIEERCFSLVTGLLSVENRQLQNIAAKISVYVTVESLTHSAPLKKCLTSAGLKLSLPFQIVDSHYLVTIEFAFSEGTNEIVSSVYASKLFTSQMKAIWQSINVFFKAHPSMKLSYGRGLRFSSISELDRWISDNIKRENENLEQALLLLERWLRRQCPDLPPVQEGAARARIRTASSTLIRKLARSNQ